MAEKKDHYRTLAGEGQGLFRDRGSKFLGFAFPANTPEAVLARLEALRQEHPKARHHCFAYRLGRTGDTFRAHDDGEPSGTAGKPMLGQIDRLGLVDVGVVVVRYFGGTKLGTSGLIQAYRTAAAEALETAPAVVKIPQSRYRIHFTYAHMGDVMAALERMDLPLAASDFGQEATVEIVLPRQQAERILLELRARIVGVSLGEAGGIDLPEGLRITDVSSSS